MQFKLLFFYLKVMDVILKFYINKLIQPYIYMR